MEIIQERKPQDLSGRFGGQFNAPGSLASGTEAVNFFILGEVSASHFPAMHLSFQDILGVHSAATLRGTQAGHLDKGFIIAAKPLQSSILSDSNFYARLTYGNRSNKGIKLSHWNAGSAHLENKTIEIENLISDHHPHLLGISEANLHKNHCIDNSRIADYELITCKTMENTSLELSRMVVYKHTSLVANV